eukprot:TRINITY_DN6791_c0_g1_i1.p1 TRINITY_DN6791_c0_g1~~TRINITY_DN6791_c0_g1_i1.p1  ORF type:complete len:123 (+),score=19.27 TRINITY_DN6791_c0_g1_i1:33-371(+)
MPDDIIYEGGVSCWQMGAWCSGTKYRITKTYVEKTTGVCCTTINNLQLVRVNDIRFTESCCCSGCSKITIFSKDPSDPVLEIVGISHARDVYDKIRDVVNGITSNAQVELKI